MICLEQFAPGQRYVSAGRRVDAAAIKAFAAEFDPQPFHLDEDSARGSFFGGLAASGWHTAALTMRLLVESGFRPAGGIIGSRADELKWPRPVRPGDELHVEAEVPRSARFEQSAWAGLRQVPHDDIEPEWRAGANPGDEPAGEGPGTIALVSSGTDCVVDHLGSWRPFPRARAVEVNARTGFGSTRRRSSVRVSYPR